MGQAVRRMGASVALVEGPRTTSCRASRKMLGKALGEALATEGIELCFGQHASAVRVQDGEYVLEFPERDELRGDRLLVATGRSPHRRVGLETVGIEPGNAGSRSTRGWLLARACGRSAT